MTFGHLSAVVFPNAFKSTVLFLEDTCYIPATINTSQIYDTHSAFDRPLRPVGTLQPILDFSNLNAGASTLKSSSNPYSLPLMSQKYSGCLNISGRIFCSD